MCEFVTNIQRAHILHMCWEGGGGVRCSTLWMGCLSAFGVWVSGPGGNWKANFISLKEETKEDAGWKKVPFLICKATAWHIRNLYAQLTTGRLIFPLQLFLSASLPIKQSYRVGLKQHYIYKVRAWRIFLKGHETQPKL